MGMARSMMVANTKESSANGSARKVARELGSNASGLILNQYFHILTSFPLLPN
jgi:hypothetical protein